MSRFLFLLSMVFLLASCGGNDDDYYYDDPYYDYYDYSYFHIKDLDNYEYRVGNIFYDCGYVEGITDHEGLFEYEYGANCIFSFDYNGITYDLGYIDTDGIATIYVLDLEDIEDEATLQALINAMDDESLEITRY